MVKFWIISKTKTLNFFEIFSKIIKKLSTLSLKIKIFITTKFEMNKLDIVFFDLSKILNVLNTLIKS